MIDFSESFIDDKLRLQVADILYSADFGDQSGYLYILIEHQSSQEELMPFRILKYVFAIMESHLKTTGKTRLPVVYSMMFLMDGGNIITQQILRNVHEPNSISYRIISTRNRSTKK